MRTNDKQRLMSRKLFFATLLAAAVTHPLLSAATPLDSLTVVQDTVARDLSDLESELRARQQVEESDTAWYGARRQSNVNALRYTLDRRHRYTGDAWCGGGFTRHTFLDFGAGMQLFQHNEGANLTPSANLHLRIGKELSPMSTVRIGGGASLGFVKGESAYASSWQLGADYLFNFSNYLAGYRPERPLSVSGILGIGLQHTSLTDREGTLANRLRASATTPTATAGLQLKVNTGSHAALTIEPYVTAGLDRMDLSLVKRTQMFDLAYGVNLSYVWYFYNNLSYSDDAGDLMRRYPEGSRLFRDDASAVNWRRPWFAEYGLGMAFHRQVPLPMSSTRGYNMSVGVGKWLSSALGVRTSLNISNAKWVKTSNSFSHTGKAGGYIDALLNPFGFTRHYNWNAPVGLNLFAGYGMGQLMVTDADHRDRQRGTFASVRAGVQLWARLSDGLRLTLEPSYERMEHYRRNDLKRIRYDEMDVKLGLQMLFRGLRDRNYDTEPNKNDLPTHGFYAAVGMGWNTSVLRYHYAGGGRGLVLSTTGLLGYQFNETHAVQGMFEYAKNPYWNPGRNQELAKHQFRNRLYSLDYRVNILNAMTGYNPHRRWNVYLYGGPTFTHSGVGDDLGANVGGMVAFRVLPYLQLYYGHTLYWLPKRQYPDGQFYNENGVVFNTLSFGALYSLNGFLRTAATASRIMAGGIGAASVAVARGTAAAAKAVGHGTVVAAKAVGQGTAWTAKAIGKGAVGVVKGIGALPWKHNDRDGRRPFFLDYGYGYGALPDLPNATGDSWGSNLQASAGTWLSSFLAIRAGVNMAKGYGITTTADNADTDHDVLNSAGYYAIAADALINPLGFRKGYNWDAPAGFNLLAGYQVGLASVFDHEKSAKNRTFSGLRLGTQIWARLDHNVRLYVEPVFAPMYLHKSIYINEAGDDVAEQPKTGYKELRMGNHWSVKVGLTLLMDGAKTRRETNREYPFEQTGVFVGVGGGWNFGLDKRRYRNSQPRMNGLLFGGLRIDRVSALRVSLEQLDDKLTSQTTHGGTATGYDRQKYSAGIASLTYQIDLTTLFGGYNENRRWEVDLFGGPAFGHRFTGKDGMQPNTLGANGGLMASLLLTPNLSAFYNHNIYLLGASDNGQLLPSEFTTHNFNTLNTFSFGVMYHF